MAIVWFVTSLTYLLQGFSIRLITSTNRLFILVKGQTHKADLRFDISMNHAARPRFSFFRFFNWDFLSCRSLSTGVYLCRKSNGISCCVLTYLVGSLPSRFDFLPTSIGTRCYLGRPNSINKFTKEKYDNEHSHQPIQKTGIYLGGTTCRDCHHWNPDWHAITRCAASSRSSAPHAMR